jgi:murein DD-endopeptidase MepM/ murein hydrolase activator NlpD
MKKFIILWLALFLDFSITTVAYGSNFWYPFAQIAKPSCRKEAWSTLDDTCKMPLPRIVNANYESYKNDAQFRRIYTVLWGGTYDYGWDIGLGSHLGVDIATSAGTPVLAIADGVVDRSDTVSGWGSVITIKHTLADKTVIYSNYAHLSRRVVSKGDTVRLGQNIGEVGNTGISYGNHLHFQIDITNQLHPYYYASCAKGKNPINIVNAWECRDFLTTHTIDPIMFIETGTMSVIPPNAQLIQAIKDKPKIIIEKQSIKSREEILNEEAEEFLKSYTIGVNLPSRGTAVVVGTPLEFNIEVRDFNKNFSSRSLPGAGVKVSVDTKKAAVFPDNFTQLYGGVRRVSVTPKSAGPIEIVFSIWKKEIARKRIYGIAKWAPVITNDSETLTTRKWYIGQEYDLYVSPLVSGWYYVGKNSYKERYRLEVIKGKAKFCLNVPKAGTSCDSGLVVEMIEFSKKDTPEGYYATRIIPLAPGNIEIRVTRVGQLNGNSFKISTETPIGLDRRHIYYDTIMSGLSKNLWKTRSGFVGQDQELTTEMTREFVLRVLNYRILKAGTNMQKRQLAINNRELFLRNEKSLESKIWSRWAFADILLKSMRVPLVKSTPVFMDENGVYQDTISTLRNNYGFEWQDQFGKRYFQPDKKITIAEAMYLAEEIMKQ